MLFSDIFGVKKSHAKPRRTQKEKQKIQVFLAILAFLARYYPHLLGKKNVFAICEGKTSRQAAKDAKEKQKNQVFLAILAFLA
jgi:hypothetical protein